MNNDANAAIVYVNTWVNIIYICSLNVVTLKSKVNYRGNSSMK